MNRMILAVSTALLLTAAMLPGQGPRGPRGQAGTGTPASVLDMSKARTVTGAVASVDIGYGMQYPSVKIGAALIKVAPVWFFLDRDFEIKAGDQLTVLAAPSTVPGDAYLYAIEITKAGVKITLRDTSGVPLWSGPADGRGNMDALHSGLGCIDSPIATASGKVAQLTMGIGIQMPSLVMQTADGKLVALKLGPERTLLEADFEIKVGDTITARYAHVSCTDEDVALQLTNAAGVTVVLRNNDGTPAWN